MASVNNTPFIWANESFSSTSIFSSQNLNWLVLGLVILAIFGTFGNLLVCASILLDKQLQTVTNLFLFSLAIADCLVSMIVLPLAIIKDFQGKCDEQDIDRLLSARSSFSDEIRLNENDRFI